jgi:hypothetical protein
MMKNKVLKLLIPVASMMLAAPAMADWPVAVADKFTVHQDHVFTELDLLENDIGSNLKVVDVNEWSENGGRVGLRNYVRTSRDQYHAYGDVSYIPREDFVGEDAFWYVIEDDQGRRNAIRVIVEVIGSDVELPKPLEDVVNVPKDTPVRIDALRNDLFSSKFTGVVNTFRGEVANFNTTTAQGGTVEKVEVYSGDKLSFGPTRFGGYSMENNLKYQLKYTPPAGFVGTDSFTYAIKDSLTHRGAVLNDTVAWTKVTLNVSEDNTISSPWPVAKPDEVTFNRTIYTGPGSPYTSEAPEISVLQNDIGEDLVLSLDSNYSQKGARLTIIPNYPNRPVITYSGGAASPVAGTTFEDKIWYVVEDRYGRKNFSYVDVTINYLADD